MKKVLAIIMLAASLVLAACATAGDTPAAPAPGTAPAAGNDAAAVQAPADNVTDIAYTINILTVSHTGEIISADHPATLQLQEHTGYNIEWEFVLNANFAEQMNMRFAAGDLPGIVALTGLTRPIVTAALSGAFWDLTDHLADWPYLADANPNIMNNIAIQGRIFGMYRERPVGRPGMVIRTDWLDYLGLDMPTTLDELYAMLEAFTVNNPEPNGGNTYGMTWTGGHMGPFHQLAIMHGAPNRWEVNNGNFVPWFEHSAFAEAMQQARWMFDNGIINPDFAALSTGEWVHDLYAGRVGLHIDVTDEARRTANGLRDSGFMTQEELDDGAMVWVMGPVANANGERRAQAQAGHAGFVAISTSGAPTEEDLWHHLNFMNALNDTLGQNILARGAEGHNWEYLGDGTFQMIEIAGGDVVEGLNQIGMRNNLLHTQMGANSREHAITATQLDNLEIAIHDPSLPFAVLSDTWTASGASLNQIIDDAVINFTMGNIDMDGFRAEVDRWYAEGGQDTINELNAAYADAQ